MAKSRDRSIVSAGDFSKGIVSDVIGAKNSVVDLVDGWIDRVGEIRKRGGKEDLGTLSSSNIWSAPANGISGTSRILETTIAAWSYYNSFNDRVSWLTRIGGFIASNQQVDTLVVSSRFGGGTSCTQFDDHLVFGAWDIDTNNLSSYNLGVWGGDTSSVENALLTGTVTLSTTSRTITGAGTLFTTELQPGMYVRFPTSSYPFVYYQVIRVNSNTDAELDRVQTDNTAGNDARTDSFRPISLQGSAVGVGGVIAGIAVASHGGRLFIGNTNEDLGKSRIRWSGTILDKDAVNGRDGMDLFYDESYLDVEPGDGGSITDMFSYGGSLVVIKDDAVFLVRGDFATKGYDLGVRVDKIFDNGAERGASSLCRYGVVFANRNGLYLWNGQTVDDLTGGISLNNWSERFAGFLNYPDRVSSVDDRVFIQDNDGSATWVYDFDKRISLRQNAKQHSKVVRAQEAQVSFSATGTNMDLVDWASDFTNDREEDADNPGYPLLEITTQPLSPDYPFFSNRPNNLYISGYTSDSSGSTPYLAVSLLHGRNEIDASGDDEQVLEYHFDTKGYDAVQRIPVDGVPDRPANRIKIRQVNTSEDTRIYGIGAEYIGDFTVDAGDRYAT